MHRLVEDTIGVEPPSLRTLQKFCVPFRLELSQDQADEGGMLRPPIPATR